MIMTANDQGQLIALVRHGETEWNRERRWQGSQGVGLNDTGRGHAAAAARILAGQGWDWMISSPAARARQTAEIIAAGVTLTGLDFDDELVEQHFGIAEGMPIAAADARWPERDYPGKEAREAVVKRGSVAMERIATSRPGNGVIVGHGAFIRITLAALTNETVPRILNGTVSMVRRNVDGWQLIDVNRAEQQ